MSRGCLRARQGGCGGELSSRWTELGTEIVECEVHMARSLARNEETRRVYGSPTPPAWFDPAYAGERWEEDY